MNSPRQFGSKAPSTDAQSLRAAKNKKITIFVLAAFVLLVMITWLGFLGWGAVAALQWLLNSIKNLLPG